MDKINKVYVCDLGHTATERDFIKSFEKVELIEPIKKLNPSKNLWDNDWLQTEICLDITPLMIQI